MFFAVRIDGTGMRTIWHEADIDASIEVFSETRPVLTMQLEPDPDGFVEAVKVGFGGILAIKSIPDVALFFAAIQSRQWTDAKMLVVEAKSVGVISQAQYDAINAAASAHNIPLML